MSGIDHVPDARDGLTHVERRLLHRLGQPDAPMQSGRQVIDRARRESELTRGEVYGVLVGMTVDHRTRYPLVSGVGDFGSADGDDLPASSLTTEVRLSAAGNEMFGAGDRRLRQAARRSSIDATIPLGGPFPTVLANGSTDGLADIPPHHLGELASAISARVDDPSIGLDDLLELMPGPDYSGDSTIVDLGDARDAYASGSGSIRLRLRNPTDPRDAHTAREVLLVAVVDGKPAKCTLLELIDHHLAHQRSVRAEAGSTDVDADIKRDLAALAVEHADLRRSTLPGLL